MGKSKTISITDSAGIISSKQCFPLVCIPIDNTTNMCFEKSNTAKDFQENKEGLFCIDTDKLNYLTYTPRIILKGEQLDEWNDKYSRGKSVIENLCVSKEIMKKTLI